MIGAEGWDGGAQHDPVTQALVLRIGRRFGDQVEYLRSIGAAGTRDAVLVDAAVQPPPEAALVIPIGVARVLHELLLEHFAGPGPGRELRADFEHERGRVDRMLDALLREHMPHPPDLREAPRG